MMLSFLLGAALRTGNSYTRFHTVARERSRLHLGILFYRGSIALHRTRGGGGGNTCLFFSLRKIYVERTHSLSLWWSFFRRMAHIVPAYRTLLLSKVQLGASALIMWRLCQQGHECLPSCVKTLDTAAACALGCIFQFKLTPAVEFSLFSRLSVSLADDYSSRLVPSLCTDSFLTVMK